jgi:LSD1 subclass zinc finger protein
MSESPASAPPATQLLCRQCAAPLPVEQGSHYVTCSFCGATNYVDKGRALFHYVVRETVRENEALAALRRWMAGNETVKGLDNQAQIEQPVFELFPMWLIRTLQNGEEMVVMEPAAALSISELKQLAIPAAALEAFDHTLDSSALAPTVPYEMMLRWLAEDHKVSQADIREVSLVHLPIYLCKYHYQGRRYTAVVDAASGKVFANLFPSKWEVPYLAIGALAFAAYLCAAFIPPASFMLGEFGGLAIGVIVYGVVALILAVPILIAALVVSAKV